MGKKKSKGDFQKVKLKVGRRIFKGGNVTNTKFKTKKIVLLEQLKQYSDCPSRPSKLNIEELLRGLDLTVSRKLLSLSKIKKIIESDDNDVSTNMYRVLSRVCKLVLDSDASVRREALSVISVIFCTVPDVQMGSLFSVLQSFISCAATHLDRDVRSGSLKLIDLVLNFYPQAICSSCSILSNFLDLISHTTSAKSKKKGVKRQLTSTPMENITAQEWHVQVLQHVLKFFEANIHLLKAETEEEDAEENCNKFELDCENHAIAIYRHVTYKPEESMTFCLKRSEFLKKDSSNRDSEFIKKFLSEFTPLLFDTWQEAVPLSQLGKSFNFSITNESIQIMMTVLQLLNNIVEWLILLTKDSLPYENLEEFKLKYGHFVQSIMMPKFPFSFPPRRIKQSDWKMGRNSQITSFTINIALCKVFALMVLDTPKCILSCQEKVKSLMLEEIGKFQGEDLENLPTFLDALTLFVNDKVSYEGFEKHFESLLTLYKQSEDLDTIICIRNFFSNLVFNSSFHALYESPNLQQWLAYLPVEFYIRVSNLTINEGFLPTIKKIAKHGYSAFIESLTENADNIIGLKSSDPNVREVLIILIPKIHKFTPELFFKLAFVINNSSLPLQSIKQIFLAFNYRVSTKKNDGFLYEDYLSFLFNVAMGSSPGDEAELIQKENDMFQTLQQTIPVTMSAYTLVPVTDWSRHMAVADVVISCLSRLPDSTSIGICMHEFVRIFLSSILHIPVHTAACVLNLYRNFLPPLEYADGTVNHLMANLVVAYCFYEVGLNSVPNANVVKAVYSLGRHFVRSPTNISAILDVYEHNKTNLLSVEMLRFAGNILRQLVDASTLSRADRECLSDFLHYVKEKFGDDILNDIWFKGLVIKLKSQAS